MKRWPIAAQAAFLAIAVATFSGCGAGQDQWQKGRPAVAKVSGTVLHEGKPLEGAIVTFFPITGAHTSFGRTDADGKFSLTTFDEGDGAVPGDYTVTISKIVVEHIPNPKDPEHLPPLHHEQYSVIPEVYGDPGKTALKASIPETGVDELAFQLTGQPKPRKTK